MKKGNQSKSSLTWKKKLCCSFLVCALALTCGAAVSCKPNDNDTSSSSSSDVLQNVTLEVGDYYYEANGVEYSLTIEENNQYVYVAGEVRYEGAYEVRGTAVTFAGSSITAEVDEGVIVLTVNGIPMRLLEKVNYTVDFRSEGVSVQTANVVNGKKVQKPADPVRTGYKFIGWYTDAAFKTAFRFDADVVTSNVTLYARWVEVNAEDYEYAVSFDLNYEGAPAAPAGIETVGGKIYDASLPAAPTREGYEFKGWWVSMYDDATKLSYQCSETATFEKDTTLYALWVKAEKTTKLAAPIVHIASDKLTWAGVENASRYAVNVTGPDGFTTVNEKTTRMEYALDLAAAPAGDYVVTVTAEAAVSNNNSDAIVLYYKNKSLAAVSNFKVVDSTLVFNGVENATRYLITYTCGSTAHVHKDYDNGNSTVYDFSACAMKEGGITFTVKAVAAGWASSEASFTVEKHLEAPTVAVDAAAESITWTPVENATEYQISLNGSVVKTVPATETSFDMRSYRPMGWTVRVTAKAHGYNPSSASVVYDKTSLATPANVKFEGTKLTWDAVSGATGYKVKIGDNEYTTTTNEFTLTSEHLDVNATSCDIQVKVVGATAEQDSLYGDVVTLYFDEMSKNVAYADGKLTWDPVLNVKRYEVMFDGGVFAVDATATECDIVFTQGGEQEIQIRCVKADNTRSDWVSIDVTAYAISFDVDGGDRVATQYKAAGDTITLPETYRSGYDFVGWYDAPNGAFTGATEYVDNMTFEGGNTTVYVCWKAKQYTLTYDYVGKEVPQDAPVNGEVTYDEAFKLAAPVSTEGDVAFIGWFSEPGGRGTQYTDKDGVSVAEWTTPSDMRVYAYWATILKFDINPADGTYNVSMGPDLKSNKVINEITIPATYKGVEVRTVASYAFDNCQYLKKINIPDTIEVIETDTAFYRCKRLEGVEIYHVDGNDGEKLWSDTDGVLVFKDNTTGFMTLSFVPICKTGEFAIPTGVTEVPLKVFASSLISKVTIPATVTAIRESAFYNCKNLEVVEFEANEDPSALLQVDTKAFENCTKLETVTLPAHLTDVSVNMFSGCNNLANINMAPGSIIYTSKDGVLCEENGTKLVICPVGKKGEFTIPSGIFTIGAGAFGGCNQLTKVILPAVVTSIEEGAFRELDVLGEVEFKGGALTAQVIGDYAFYGCSELVKVSFAADCYVDSIGKHAFADTGLSQLTIPGRTAKVDDYAFANCKLLDTVNIAEAIGGTQLAFGSYVFQNCTGIEEINLPASVTKLELGVFEGCNNLQNVFVAEESEHFSHINGVLFNEAQTELWFYPIGRKGSYSIPTSVEKIMPSVFKNNPNLTSITINANITTIGDYAFNGCSALETITIENADNNLVLGQYAFANCIALKEIVLPERVSALSQYLFYGSSALKSVTIKGEVQTIAAYAFASTGLNEIVLPESATSIGNYAFSGSDIVTVEIPAGVTMGTYVFKDCKSLESVTFADGFADTTIAAGTFQNSTLQSIEIPTSITKIDTDAFNGATNLTTVTYKNNTSKLKTIGNKAFYKCAALTSFEIPNSVTTIGTQTFAECTALSSVTLTDSSKLTKIGSKAFQKSTLTSFFVPKSVTTIDTYAFDNCTKLKQVTFSQEAGKGLTIKQRAFYATGIQGELNLPARLATLQTYHSGSGAAKVTDAYIYEIFMASKGITALNVAEGCANYASVDGVIYSADKTIVWIAPEGKQGDVTFANTVTNVKSYAFYNCTGITSVTFEELEAGAEGTLVIGSYNPGTTVYDLSKGNVFRGCSSLQTLHLPQHLTYIGYYAFGYTPVLESVSIPAAVTALGKNVFYSSGIASVTFEKEADGSRALTEMGASCFQNCVNLKEVEIPKELKTLNGSMFSDASKLEKITFEEGSILDTFNGSYIFGDTAAKEIVFPETLSSIGTYSLSSSSFEKINMPAGLLSIPQIGRMTTLKYVDVHPDHPTYQSKDGVIYDKDESNGLTLAIFPAGKTGHFEIPSGVKKIASEAFQMTSLTEVTIPNTVIDIGDGAFIWNDSLEKVNFEPGEENLTMMDPFFWCYALKEITIPYRVTTMGTRAFEGCEALETVIFEKGSRMTSIGAGAIAYGGRAGYDYQFLIDCPNLKTVVLPENLESIGESFHGCTSLETIVLPETLKEIPAATFIGCTSLKSVTVSSELTGIGEYAFQDTALTTMTVTGREAEEGVIYIPATVTEVGKGAFTSTAMNEVVFEEGCAISYIGDYTFAGCVNLKEVNIPETVETIGKYAFGNKKQTFSYGSLSSVTACDATAQLTSVGIPAIVTSIGEGAFSGCASLENEVLPMGLTDLGAYAFYGCESLKEITVPSGVATIGKYTFSGCTGLTSLTIYEGPTELGDYAFEGCSNVTQLYIPGSITKLGINPFAGWTGLLGAELDAGNVSVILEDGALYNTAKSKLYAYLGDGSQPFTVPESVKEIAAGAFAGTNVSTVILHNGISAINDYTFANCPKLETIDLPESIRSIGLNAFQGSDLKSITIGKNVNTISDYAFEGCAALSKVEFAEGGLEALPLGKYAFANCTALTEISLPRRVSSDYYTKTSSSGKVTYYGMYAIGANCFSGCTNLKTVTFETTGAKKEGINQFSITLGTSAFENCTSLVSIHLPETFGYVMPDGLTSVSSKPSDFSSSVFKNCTSLEEVTFAKAKFTSLGSYMFEGCTSLRRFNVAAGEEDCINIPDTVTSMSTAIFKNCTSVTKIKLPSFITSIGTELLMNTAITEIEIPETVTYIYAYAFYGCKNLKSVDVPAKVTQIYNHVFAECTSLESVTLPNGLTKLGGSFDNVSVNEGSTFANCTNIKSITIPATVTTILAYVFDGWTAEQTINVVGLKSAPSSWYIHHLGDWNGNCEAKINWGC